LPTAQAVHVAVPVLVAYVPAAQFVHTDAPAALYVPTAQAVHVVVPVLVAYVPAAQFVHVVAPAAL